jgi:hypothetical protein
MSEVELMKEDLLRLIDQHNIKLSDILLLVIHACTLMEKIRVSGSERKRIVLEILQSIIPQELFNAFVIGVIVDNVILLSLHKCPSWCCCF